VVTTGAGLLRVRRLQAADGPEEAADAWAARRGLAPGAGKGDTT
jgi:hypothetical protein